MTLSCSLPNKLDIFRTDANSLLEYCSKWPGVNCINKFYDVAVRAPYPLQPNIRIEDLYEFVSLWHRFLTVWIEKANNLLKKDNLSNDILENIYENSRVMKDYTNYYFINKPNNNDFVMQILASTFISPQDDKLTALSVLIDKQYNFYTCLAEIKFYKKSLIQLMKKSVSLWKHLKSTEKSNKSFLGSFHDGFLYLSDKSTLSLTSDNAPMPGLALQKDISISNMGY